MWHPHGKRCPICGQRMICDSYIIYVCPDPDCVVWDMHPEICDDHHAHPHGDYPRLKPLTVHPRREVLEAYRKPRLLIPFVDPSDKRKFSS